MNWKTRLVELEQKKSWDNAILLLQNSISDDSNDKDAYIALSYLLMNLLVEEEYDSQKHDYYAALLKSYFEKSYKKFEHDAEYLFFMARIGYISEWYLNITLEQVRDMDFKALSLDPNNILYRWSYIVLLDDTVAHNKNILIDYALMVLEENSYIKEILLSKGSLGKYIYGIMVKVSQDLKSKLV
jgi:hypothetical protein